MNSAQLTRQLMSIGDIADRFGVKRHHVEYVIGRDAIQCEQRIAGDVRLFNAQQVALIGASLKATSQE